MNFKTKIKLYLGYITEKDLNYGDRLDLHFKRQRKDPNYSLSTSAWMFQQPEIQQQIETLTTIPINRIHD